MDYQQMIDTMAPDVYQRLKLAVEIGKWPDGSALTPEQRASAMQAIIAWGEKHLEEQERVGYIDKKDKAGERCEDPQEMPLNWKNQES